MASKNYRNYAFISYQRKDEKWAIWLQHRLENYKLPAVAHGDNTDGLKYIRPVFRDKTDLTGGILSEALKKELRHSRFLILICSPDSAESEWVNEEVKCFIEDDRVDAIIPFILRGSPHSNNPKEECFPRCLREIPDQKEVLGIDIREGGKERAFIKTVAYMLGLRFDDLWQRYKRRTKRLHYLEATACFLAIGIALGIWDYKRTKVEYFADYVDSFGVPQGIIHLSKDEMRHRFRSWRFEYRRTPLSQPSPLRWRISSIQNVNSADVPKSINHTEQMDRYPIQLFEYSPETGILSRSILCDEFGRKLLRYQYSEREGKTAAVVDFISSQEQQGSAFVGGNHLSMTKGEMDYEQQKSRIVRYFFERNSTGHIVRQSFHCNNDYQISKSAISDADGIFGMAYILDSLGRRIRVEYLGADGQKISTKQGISGREYEYDQWGNISKTTYIKDDDQPILNEKKWAFCINLSDEYGNIVETQCFGADGKPCYIDIGASRHVTKYDKRGNLTEERCYGTNGQPVINKQGFSKKVYLNDKRGNVIADYYYDTEEEPCIMIEGYSFSRAKYDRKNRQIEKCFYDKNSHPTLCRNGFAKVTKKYDSRDNLIEITYYDQNGKRCICSDDLYSRAIIEYDQNGRQTKVLALDKNDSPCYTNNGFASSVRSYDDRGNLAMEEYYNPEGKLCLNKDGVARAVSEYDDAGNITDLCYFDNHDKRCFSNEGVARVQQEYDEKGNRTTIRFFDVNDVPCLSSEGVASIIFSYDTWGNLTRVEYYDTSGNLTKNIMGVAIESYTFDEKYNLIELVKYDDEGHLAADEDGVARYTYCYDQLGHILEYSYFGTDGRPCLYSDGAFRSVFIFDERGNPVKESYFGIHGEPIINSKGYSSVEYEYDDHNNLVVARFYGTDNAPCVSYSGYAKILFSYDDLGRIIREEYFGVDGKRCNNLYGVAIQCSRFDVRGNNDGLSFYGPDEHPCVSQEYGFSKAVNRYDERGKVLDTSYYDENGKPCMPESFGYHCSRFKYDERGNEIESSLYDSNLNLCLGKGEFAICRMRYDEQNRQIEGAYFGVMGEPINAGGYHMEVRELDDYGNTIKRFFYDTNMTLLSSYIYTMSVVDVDPYSFAAFKRVPIGSIIIKYNDWVLGMSETSLSANMNKCKYSSKSYYYVTPDGLIDSLYIDKGLSGLWLRSFFIEDEYSKELLSQLNNFIN